MVDTDNNGSIDYSEFVTACVNREKMLSKNRLKTTFKMFDKDGSGSIEIKELKEAFKRNNVDNSVWESLMKEVDENADGEISYEEFADMMQTMI